jgi:hypothetical protein
VHSTANVAAEFAEYARNRRWFSVDVTSVGDAPALTLQTANFFMLTVLSALADYAGLDDLKSELEKVSLEYNSPPV